MQIQGLLHAIASFAAAEERYPTWFIALSFTLVSGFSLPLGAAIGIGITPSQGVDEMPDQGVVNADKMQRDSRRKAFVGSCLAFGAGSLLFAVTVELYGKQMRRLQNHGYLHHIVGMMVTTVAAFLGGVIYTYTNQKLCNVTEGRCDPEHESTPLVCSSSGSLSGVRGSNTSNKSAAGLSMWLGVFIDGLPEGILLGFLAAEHHLSMVLVISLFIANFPEAFSSACLLHEARWSPWKILSMWTFHFLLTAILAMISCELCPVDVEANLWVRIFECLIEGLAGGAMLACITAVMLPEAYEIHHDAIGLLCLAGFLVSVMLKVVGGVASELATKVHPYEEVRTAIPQQLPVLGT